MSVLQYPDGINPTDVQIWNNAAFDNGDSEDLSSLKLSWLRPSDSFESDMSSKENQTPLYKNFSVNISSPMPIKPLQPNGAMENSRIKSNKPILTRKNGKDNDLRDVKKIDEEIEEIEMEISRLNSKLEALRIEKAEKSVVKTVEKRGRVVAAKFMEPKMSAKTNVQRRGVSLGPSEIFGATRRGLSMGPSEILAGTKAEKLGKQEMITPVQPITNRRKSCFWKLQEIEEESLSSKERGKSSVIARTMVAPRQAVTTIASKKNVKKDDGFLSSVQPKKLFKDGEKSNKKPQRPGRIVASRYNQSTNQSSVVRKRSLPESDKDVEIKRNEKKRSLSVGKTRVSQTDNNNLGTESSSRVKKRWEIPSEIVVHASTESEKSPLSITVKPDLLPRIRIARCNVNETPRDSGPAKRVVELIGKKSFFSNDEDKEPSSVCQVLSFAEEDAEEE
ncbi:hypothetical protein K7X08_032471 [Anisodus acutangulus]|uniref:Uncharacterized protein n=1 Tax=Anisodus acutangulus TaxID=402998 RepID=A0A9Q1MUJ1_9SOLA|nr:hypothetical protein K7X08_032471 [Anisodus acutangulus]